MDHGNIAPRLTTLGVMLLILPQPPITAKPTKGPLHDPPLSMMPALGVGSRPSRKRMRYGPPPGERKWGGSANPLYTPLGTTPCWERGAFPEPRTKRSGVSGCVRNVEIPSRLLRFAACAARHFRRWGVVTNEG